VELAAEADGPLLVHAPPARTDRGGHAVSAAGRRVTRAEVVADYLRTEPELPAIFARAPELSAIADPTRVQQLLGVPAEAIAPCWTSWTRPRAAPPAGCASGGCPSGPWVPGADAYSEPWAPNPGYRTLRSPAIG